MELKQETDIYFSGDGNLENEIHFGPPGRYKIFSFVYLRIVAIVKTKHMIVNNINGLMPQCSDSKGG